MADSGARASVVLAFGRMLASRPEASEITICGQSMGPLFARPCRVLVQPGSRSLRPGDILLYASGRGMVAHRLLAIRRNRRGRFYLAKGDTNYHCDGLFPERAVLGRVAAVVRPEGTQPLPRRRAYARATYYWVRLRQLLPWRVIKAGRRLHSLIRRYAHVP